MEKPFKLQENSYEQSKAVDQFRLLSHRKAIRPDELERHVFKAIEQQKHSSFHELIGPVLTVGQFFGNLPVIGVLDPDVRNISFKWTAVRTIYTLTYLLVGAFEVCTMVLKGFSQGFNILTAELIMFYFDCIAQSCLFLFLATKWKRIMTFWTKMEKPFLYEPYTSSGMSLSLKIRLIGFIFFAFYVTEHLLFIGMELQDNHNQILLCNVSKRITFLHNYMRRERPHLLDVLPYRWWIFPIFQWTITLMAFCWNFTDYFCIILSLGLTTRFNQLNERLRQTPISQMDRTFWLDIRLHYTNLVDLVELIDRQISFLLLFSLSHNLFLVCTKIFEAIKYANGRYLINVIYFYLYLSLLIIRTLYLLYACSSVHHVSRYPLVAIRNTPTAKWNVTLKRLSDMIETEDVSLSGHRFFFITRPMILAMVGTIVTFELVLLDRGKRDEDGDTCAYFANNIVFS